MLIKPIKRVEMSIKPTRHSELSIKPIKRGELPIKPVSVTNSNISFGAIVKANSRINQGFEMAFNLLKNPTMKDLESSKSFYDSIRKIASSKKVKIFDLELVKEGSSVFPMVNGSKLDIILSNSPYLQESYIVQEGCKKFAESLPEKQESTVLDSISKKIIQLRSQLAKLEENYKDILQEELSKLQKEIA